MVGKPEVLRVSLFLNPERAQDVQPKFAYEIVATSNCRLRQNVVCAALPNAPPAFNESVQPRGAQPRDGLPGKQPLASPSVAVSPKEKAWHTLQTACTGDKATDRANATRVLGLIRNDVKATKLAEKTLSDPKPEVRAAAAAALGGMNSRRSIPKLKKALDDKDPSVALAAAHSLHLMRNNSAYEVYSEILAKQRKGGK